MSEWLEMDGGAFRLRQGDCLDLLRELPDASVDAVVTDPPAGIGFMNQEWDRDKGGRDAWVAWMSSVMTEVRRVMKPGAHALVWALPKTSHWTGWALENAGLEPRDVAQHLFGSGFPKSLNVSAAIDAELGAAREPVAVNPSSRPNSKRQNGGGFDSMQGEDSAGVQFFTAPATPEAEAWDGWGTALKPGAEFWWLVRKPLAEKNVARNVLRHGCGGINVDGCRIGTDGEQIAPRPADPARRAGVVGSNFGFSRADRDSFRAAQAASIERTNRLGRWPANVLLSHTPACELAGTRRVQSESGGIGHSEQRGTFKGGNGGVSGNFYADPDGLGTVEDWRCAEGCPVRLLDEQSGERVSGGPRGGAPGFPKENGHPFLGGWDVGRTHGDTGGASRFYYCAKPSQHERSAGLHDRTARNVNDGRATSIDNPYQRGDTERKNTHPTVKSRDLMAWLCRLITPPGAVILDPFMGSGSTALGCLDEGFRFIGFEKEPEYFEIARLRLAYWLRLARQQPSLF